LRETVKAALLGVGGEERRVVRELARRLVATGLVSDEDDVWLLADDELDRLASRGECPDSSAILRRRTTLDAARAAPPLPEVFSGTPQLEPTSDNRAEEPGVVAGWAASPGRVIGTALVVRDLADAASLEPGEVVVGRSTDASWTPLFLVAGAIVMEEGGPLSHAAIVARELRLPAVLNAKDATRRIRTGMHISVDGSRGVVEILDLAQQDAA
jgi:phosphohistidine swiveling domain-containing protein